MIIDIRIARSSTPSPATTLHGAAQRWQREIARVFDRYRPECHYMRGPGPKCREKYGLSRGAP